MDIFIGKLNAGHRVGPDAVKKILKKESIRDIQEQLNNLDVSAEYEKILEEIHKEVNNKTSGEILDGWRNRKKKPKVEFDVEGVSKVLTNKHHLGTFRDAITKGIMADIVPKENQVALARSVVRSAAKDQKRELSSTFIRSEIGTELLKSKTVVKKLTAEEQELVLRENDNEKVNVLCSEFSRHCRGMVSAVSELEKMENKMKDRFFVTSEFRKNYDAALGILARLKKLNRRRLAG